ncbi:MAG: acyl-CoA dehydrogenase family protein [Mycobacteriaceae bacterium]
MNNVHLSALNEEQQLLKVTLDTALSKKSDALAVRRAIESPAGYDHNLWELLCTQVGVSGLIVPEEYGGSGGSLPEAAIAVESLGARLVPTPLLGNLFAEIALIDSGNIEACERLLPELAQGITIGTVIFDPQAVLNGSLANLILAVVDDKLFELSVVHATRLQTMDPTRQLAYLEYELDNGQYLGTVPELSHKAAVLIAAEQMGAATQCLNLTVEYTKTREQFGRPIGSFQALKHRMADLLVQLEAARAVVCEAVADPSADNAALARITATETFSAITAEAIQMHGGIAITWEHDIQLYFKRAHGTAMLFGQTRDYLRKLAPAVGLRL